MTHFDSIRVRPLRALFIAVGLAAGLLAFSPTGAEAQRTPGAASAQTDGVVNIQTASLDQLQLLPGIGPSKAQAILAQRERRAFRRVEDLMRVRGIGRATFRRLRSMLTVDGATTLQPPRRATRTRGATAASATAGSAAAH